MRPQIRNSLVRMTRKATEFSDSVTVRYVSSEGNVYPLTALRWTDTRLSAEGIQIFYAGVEDQEQRIFRFERAEMESAGIGRFDMSGHFILGSERWDVVGGHPQAFNLDPSPSVILVLRKAVEKAGTVCGSTFGFDTDE